ncbi:MAG: LysR family transcriptional regulator [Firmicutes bacterium]|nr:LysR family transcriptional regulator [Bacillota bacterium]
MTFQNMEYFLKVAETGSITEAARELNITQQALSSAIARMEAELGCELFDRHSRLQLTYAGTQYKEAVVRMMDIQSQTREMLADISGNVRGQLRIGIAHTRGQALLPLILPDFIRRYPLVNLSILEDSTRELERHLAHGDLDVVIGFAPFMLEEAMVYPLMKEQLYLVIPKVLLEEHFGKEKGLKVLEQFRKTHDIRLFRDFPFVFLKEGDRVRSIVTRLFDEAGFEPFIKLETGNTQTTLALASEGVGLTVCPKLYLNSNYIASGFENAYIRQRIEICPLFAEEEAGYIGIGYNRERYLSRFAEDFIRIAREKLL